MTENNLPSSELKVTNLPSGGKAYPSDVEFNYTSYSFGEVKYASTSNLTERQVLELILKGVKTSFNKNNLTIHDAMYIGILRKLASLGTAKAKVPFEVKGKLHEHIFTMEDIEFKDIAAPKLPVRVTLSNNEEYSFMPLTVANFLKLVKMGKGKDSCASLATMCTSHDFQEAYNFFKNTKNFDDGEILEHIDEILDHGIMPLEVTYQDEVNGEIINRKAKIRLERRQALLTPFREKGESIRGRVQFGDAPKSESE
jgi:hypothetical protein